LTQAVPEIAQRVADWASQRDDIQGVVLVGSHARNAASRASDIDLVIVTRTPGEYLAPDKQAWVEAFGDVATQKLEHYGLVTSLRVRYTDGVELELGITGEEWATPPLDPKTRAVLDQGMVVLFERGDLGAQLR
jgi:predicted nucleotidyltransferase